MVMGQEPSKPRWAFRRLALGLLMTLILGAAGCGGDDAETQGATGADGQAVAGEANVLRIGAAVSRSGELFEPGSRVDRGYEFWAKTVNESGGIQVGDERYTVELVVLDDESDPTTAAQLAQRLVSQEDVDFMFGPYSSGLTIAVGAITDRNQVLTIAPGGNADDIYEQNYEYVFGIIPKASDLPGFWLEAMLSQTPKPQTLGILSKNDVFPQSQRGGLKEDAEAAGIPIVTDEVYAPEQQDFATAVSELRRRDPDILAVLGHTEDSALIVRQMKEQSYYPPGGVLFTGPAMLDFQTLLKDDANYSYGITFWEPSMGWEGDGQFGSAQEYADAFEEEYGSQPSYQNATASQAGVVLQLAMERAGSVDPGAVREAILAEEFQTFGGPVQYASNGLNEAGQVGVNQIQEDGVYLVHPSEFAERDPITPVPGWPERQ